MMTAVSNLDLHVLVIPVRVIRLMYSAYSVTKL
jgi:hypothetical protein